MFKSIKTLIKNNKVDSSLSTDLETKKKFIETSMKGKVNGKPFLILLRGPHGTGKTTLAKYLVAAGVVSTHYEADQRFETKDGDYKFSLKLLAEAYKTCQLRTELALFEKKNVVVSNLSLSWWEVELYQRMAKRANANFIVMDLTEFYGLSKTIPEKSVQKAIDTWTPMSKFSHKLES